MIEKKYVLTDETMKNMKTHKVIHRIQAVRSFGDVAKGQLGGFVESEHNLSHSGLCWIYEDAKAFDDAVVSGNAQMHDRSRIYDHAQLFDSAQIYGGVYVKDNAKVFGNSRIFDNMIVEGDTRISEGLYINCEDCCK